MEALPRRMLVPSCSGVVFLSRPDVVYRPNPSQAHDWIVDGGATSRITTHREDFIIYIAEEPVIVMGLMKPAVGYGDVHIEADTTLCSKKLIFRRVLHVPGLVESGITMTRLFRHHACYSGRGHWDPVFTYALRGGAITFNTFEILLTTIAIVDSTRSTSASCRPQHLQTTNHCCHTYWSTSSQQNVRSSHTHQESGGAYIT